MWTLESKKSEEKKCGKEYRETSDSEVEAQ